MSLHHEPCRHHPQPLDPPLVRAGHCSQCARRLSQHRFGLPQAHCSWRAGQACATQCNVVKACPTGPAACLPVVLSWLLCCKEPWFSVPCTACTCVVACRWAAYPPAPEKLREVYQLGYRDAVTW